MFTFNHSCPTKVIFGCKSLENIVTCLPINTESVLVVSSKTAARKSGAMDILENVLSSNKIKIHFRNTITPNPKFNEVDELSSFINDNSIDAIIAIGGGSVLDAAKAIALCGSVRLPVSKLISSDYSYIKPIPLIAIPTTSGTGSEVSKGAILSDPENTWKGGLRGENVFPKYALLDPLLTTSLPIDITLETGFDVCTHSFESLLSKAATPITILYSKESLSITIPILIEIARTKEVSLVQREKLMYSSLLAGYNLANASTCLPHRMQYPLGAHTDSSHARGLASLYPSWIKHTYEHAKANIDFLLDLIEKHLTVKSIERNANYAFELISLFLEVIEMNHSMRDFGVLEEHCSMYVEEVEGNLSLDPGLTDKNTLLNIYKESW